MPGPIYEGFDAVEALQESSEASGWDIEYRQIERGRLVAKTRYREVGDIPLIVESANLSLDIAGSTPDDAITVLVPGPCTNLLVNGSRLTDGRIVMLGPGEELRTTSGSNSEVASAHVPTTMFAEYAEEILHQSRGLANNSTLLVSAGSRVQKLHDTLIAAIIGDDDGDFAREAESELVSALLCLFESAQVRNPARDKYHRLDKRRSLRRALDYIEQNLHGTVRMPDVCAYAGLSQSTLERVFRAEFQQSPSRYIRSRRLEAVRRDILRGRFADPVVNVALDHGFHHMGRFATYYRQQFGVLPSEDRQGS